MNPAPSSATFVSPSLTFWFLRLSRLGRLFVLDDLRLAPAKLVVVILEDAEGLRHLRGRARGAPAEALPRRQPPTAGPLKRPKGLKRKRSQEAERRPQRRRGEHRRGGGQGQAPQERAAHLGREVVLGRMPVQIEHLRVAVAA